MNCSFQKVWDKGIADSFLNDLLELCHHIYNILTDDDRPVENVTQYCKKKVCWENVKKGLSNYSFPETSLSAYLISNDVYRSKKNEAKKEQGFVDEVGAYQVVTKAPYRRHWMDLVRFLTANQNLFPSLTDSALNTVLRVANMDAGKMGSSFPSGKDCLLALDWWSDAEKMGWKV